MGDDHTIAWPLAKIASAWAAVGVTSWADFASFIAAIYTTCLLGEWLWKKFFKSRKPGAR